MESYIVVVIDSNGFEAESSPPIFVIPLSVTLAVDDTVPCSPTLIATVNGGSPFSGATMRLFKSSRYHYNYVLYKNGFEIESGEINPGDFTFNPTETGTYKITVTDINGCMATSSSVFFQILNITLEYPPCSLNLIAFPSGARISQTFTINTPSGSETGIPVSIHIDSFTVPITEVGNYSVSVEDGNGCTASSQVIDVTSLPFTSISYVVIDQSICTVGIMVTTVGGTGTYTYNLYLQQHIDSNSDSNSELGTLVQTIVGGTSETLSATENGLYAITVTDTNGCEHQVINIPISIEPTIVIDQTPLCNSVLLTATPSCSTPVLSYQWYNSSGIIAGEMEPTLEVTVADEYHVNITYDDVNLDVQTSGWYTEVTSIPVESVTIALSNGQTTCSGILTASSICNNFTSYQWYISPANTPIAEAIDPTLIITSNGSYYVQVTYDDADSQSHTIQSNILDVTTLTTEAVTIQLSSSGCTYILTAISSCYNTITYQWYNSPANTPIANATNNILDVTANGGYYVIGSYSDVNSVPQTATSNIITITTQLISLTINVVQTTTSATLTAVVVGGVPTVTYLWNTTERTSSIIVTTTGTYICTVTDGNGCSLMASVSITIVNPAFSLEVKANGGVVVDPCSTIYLCGYIQRLMAILTGGTTPYYYKWIYDHNVISRESIVKIRKVGLYKLIVADADCKVITFHFRVKKGTCVDCNQKFT